MQPGVFSKAFLAAVVLLGAAGCAEARERVRLARAVASLPQAGHTYRTFRGESSAMIPTIPAHSFVITDLAAYVDADPSRRDMVVFYSPIARGEPIIDRVVGLPGNRFRIQRGVVFVNDQPLPEPYLTDSTAYDLQVRDYTIYVSFGSGWEPLSRSVANIPDRRDWKAPDRLPPGCFLALGDRRNDSEDSHIWGCAQFHGTFASGPNAGKAAELAVGKVVRILPPLRGT